MTVCGDKTFQEWLRLNEVMRVALWSSMTAVLTRGRDTRSAHRRKTKWGEGPGEEPDLQTLWSHQISIWSSSLQIVREQTAVAQTAQSVISCYGSPCRLMQTPKLKISHNNCSQNTETPRNKPNKAAQHYSTCMHVKNYKMLKEIKDVPSKRRDIPCSQAEDSTE